MALTDEERLRRMQVIHVLNDLSSTELDKYDRSVKAPVNEAADTRMVNLEEIGNFLEGKTVPYARARELDTNLDTSMTINLFFMSTKKVKVAPSNNRIEFTVELRDPEDDMPAKVVMSNKSSATLEDFIGLPEQVDSPDFKSVDEIVDLCNAEEIYNIYKKFALDLINSRMPTAYNLFATSGMRQIRVTKGDRWWNAPYNIHTLAVSYLPDSKQFVYFYHPEFILSCAIDEWFLNRRRYETFRDCYCYILTFMITHEMMHILHHNNTTVIDMGEVKDDVSNLDRGDPIRMAEEERVRELQNIQQDNFINTSLSKVFARAPGLRDSYRHAPMPRVGIGSSMTFRAEHNQGFKYYESFEDFAKAIMGVVADVTKIPSLKNFKNVYFYNQRYDDISALAGADVFVQLYVDPSTPMRESSGIFQKVTNEIMKVISAGKMYSQNTKLTAAEKETDKAIIPNGSLVEVRVPNKICVVAGYDEATGLYSLEDTTISTKREKISATKTKCTPVYTPNGNDGGTKRRREIRPFDPESHSWYESAEKEEKKTKLSAEDLQALNAPDMPSGGQQNASQASNEPEKKDSNNIEDTVIGMLIALSAAAQAKISMENDRTLNAKISRGMSKIAQKNRLTMKDLQKKINACVGKTDDESRNILGDDVFNDVEALVNELTEGENSSKPDNQSQSGAGQAGADDDYPVYNIGDIVWVRRAGKYGRITNITSDGKFELEEMQELQVKILDDSNNYITEAGNRMVLKERQFAPTGRKLGTFTSKDLESFEMTYTETDKKQPNQGGEQPQGPQKKSSVPKPKDDDPLKPEKDEDEESGNAQSQDGGAGQGSGDDEEEQKKKFPDKWDVEGQDLDADEPPPPPETDKDKPQSGSGRPSDRSSGEQAGDSEEGDNSDQDNSQDGEGQDSEGSDDTDSDGEGTDSEDSDGSEDDNGTSNKGKGRSGKQDSGEETGDEEGDDSDSSGDSEGEDSEDSSTDDKQKKGKGSKRGQDSQDSDDEEGEDSSDGDSSDSDNDSDKPENGSSVKGKRQDSSQDDSQAGAPPNDGWDEEDDDDSSYSNSDLAQALENIDKQESSSAKERRESERKGRTETAKNEPDPMQSQRSTQEEMKKAQEMLTKAVKEANKNKKDDSGVNGYGEDDLLGGLGAGTMTSNFNRKMTQDWKAKMERLLRKALGFDIVINPNMINKRIEDAPPGREDEEPKIKNVIILMDCSSSMGADKFAKVIKHIDSLFMAFRMENVNFHIFDFGVGPSGYGSCDSAVSKVLSTYVKVKGRQFKKEILKHKAYMDSTCFVPPIVAISTKVRKPDAILIFTDGELLDDGIYHRRNTSYYSTAEMEIVEKYIRKFHDKMVWVLTSDSYIQKVLAFDKKAKSDGRTINFRKD